MHWGRAVIGRYKYKPSQALARQGGPVPEVLENHKLPLCWRNEEQPWFKSGELAGKLVFAGPAEPGKLGRSVASVSNGTGGSCPPSSARCHFLQVVYWLFPAGRFLRASWKEEVTTSVFTSGRNSKSDFLYYLQFTFLHSQSLTDWIGEKGNHLTMLNFCLISNL